MNNADLPASPVCESHAAGISVENELALATMGLSKREYFAANAPELPRWFLPADQENIKTHGSDPKREASIWFEWRAYYAEMMLKQLEK